MTVGGVAMSGWPWGVLVLFLALYGLFDLCLWAAGKLRGLAGQVRWWLRDRMTPLLERPEGVLCAGCAGDSHCDGVEGGCDCTCGWSEDWAEEELPPERSWEQITSHQPPVVDTQRPEFWTPENQALLRPERERRPPWWESFHRAQYAALDLEYPSGLLARVREAAQ